MANVLGQIQDGSGFQTSNGKGFCHLTSTLPRLWRLEHRLKIFFHPAVPDLNLAVHAGDCSHETVGKFQPFINHTLRQDPSWGTAAVWSATPARLNTSCCLKKLNALGGRRRPALAVMPPQQVCDLRHNFKSLQICYVAHSYSTKLNLDSIHTHSRISPPRVAST